MIAASVTPGNLVPASSPTARVETTGNGTVVHDPQTNGRLLAAGAVVLIVFVVSLGYAALHGSATKVVGPPSQSSSTPSSSSAPATVTTTTTTTSAPSDTVLGLLLGTGAVFLVAGALYWRISAIKFPGGGEVDLNPAEQAAVMTAALTHTQGQPPEQQQAQVLQAALAVSRDIKRQQRGVLEPADVNLALERAAALTHDTNN